MLKMENVNSYYGRSKALQDFSLEVAAETIFAVLGRNGVGKTTLLRTILGLTGYPRTGEIWYCICTPGQNDHTRFFC